MFLSTCYLKQAAVIVLVLLGSWDSRSHLCGILIPKARAVRVELILVLFLTVLVFVNFSFCLIVRLETTIHFILCLSIRFLGKVVADLMYMGLLADIIVCLVEIISRSHMGGVAAAGKSLVVTIYVLLLLLLGHSL